MLFKPKDSSGVDALNAEFLRLLQASGWNKARAARELYLDPSAITRYVNLEARPSMTVLKLFSELLGERLTVGENEAIVPASTLGGPRHLENWEGELVDLLRELDPVARRAATEALVTLVRSLRQEPRTTSAEASKASASPALAPAPSGGSDVESLSDDATRKTFVSALAAAGGRRAVELIEQKRKAASPSGSKDAPAPTAPAKKGAPQSSPTRARK